MSQEKKEKTTQRMAIKSSAISFIQKWLTSQDLFGILSKDRYKNLKMRIVLLDAILSMIPLIIVVTISYFWFQSILKDDYRNQSRWQIENTKQTVEFFIEEKLSGLRFLSSAYSYEQLSDEKFLSELFLKFKKEFSGLVDLGVIDSNGFQKSYVGPYSLMGKDYSNQDWFHEVVIRSAYVSDVFMGYRKIPHFAIAVKREMPEKGIFWILRATIDMHTLEKYASAMNLRDNDDAFIITHEGILQTPSRFHGNVLEKIPLPIKLSQEVTLLQDTTLSDKNPAIFGYAAIKNSPWFLVTIINSSPYLKIPNIFKNELVIITVLSIIFSIFVTIALAQSVVNRIKKADQELEQAIESTEHASKLASIGRLAAGVAHEINNPLAIINEKAGLMKDILETSEDIRENKDKFLILLHGVFESVNRCRTITHRLLGFSRRMDVGHDAIDLNDAVREVLGFIEKEILYRDIVLTLNLADTLPKVVTDKGQIQQVFLNIINNAVDAVDEGGQIEVASVMQDAKTVRVSVKDNGIGIPKEKLKHIFEPFYTTKEKGKGTGLGLSISYGIMQRLGGTLQVESEVHKGTTFIVEVPINAEAAK
jgi:two-component system, NtrC family, sensor kinase